MLAAPCICYVSTLTHAYPTLTTNHPPPKPLECNLSDSDKTEVKAAAQLSGVILSGLGFCTIYPPSGSPDAVFWVA